MSAHKLDKVSYLLLGAIALMWGSQFFLNEIAIQSISPLNIAYGRILVGCLTLTTPLLLIPAFRRKNSSPFAKEYWLKYFFLALFEATIPFVVIPWGQTFVDSGVTSILVGMIPIFAIILARFLLPGEPFRLGSILSVLGGFLGLVILMGPNIGGQGGERSTLGALAILSGAFSFAFALILLKKLDHPSPVATVRNILFWSFLQLTPIAFFLDSPLNLNPSLPSLTAVALLGCVCAGVVYVFYVILIARAGPTFASLSNYLVPAVGVFLGVVFLGEPIYWNTVLALMLIFLSTLVNKIGKVEAQKEGEKR